jgi:flagellin-like protein
MRKLNRKGLSPVVASIILIAVTVAISLAVAVWMGALTFEFMPPAQQVTITNVQFLDINNNVLPNESAIEVTVQNVGSSAVNITFLALAEENPNLLQNTYATLVSGQNCTLTEPCIWLSNQPYTITVGTSSGFKAYLNQVSPQLFFLLAENFTIPIPPDYNSTAPLYGDASFSSSLNLQSDSSGILPVNSTFPVYGTTERPSTDAMSYSSTIGFNVTYYAEVSNGTYRVLFSDQYFEEVTLFPSSWEGGT